MVPDPPPPPDAGPGDPPPPSPLQRLVRLADASLNSVRLLGLASLASAIGLWFWALGGVAGGSLWGALFTVPVLIVLIVPAAVIGFLYWGLLQIRSIPNRAVDAAAAGREHAGALWHATWHTGDPGGRRIWNVLRAVREIWSLVMDSKELVLGYVAIARLANPVSLIVILSSVVAGAILCALAVVTLVAVLVF